MAKVLYFNGTTQIEFHGDSMDNAKFAAAFPGIAGRRCDSFSKWVGKVNGETVPVTRVIFRKANPSNHKCGARCRHAKGGDCECACGGKYHGAGNG